jgi:hypothetical protein
MDLFKYDENKANATIKSLITRRPIKFIYVTIKNSKMRSMFLSRQNS